MKSDSFSRLRRLRVSETMRDLVRETAVSVTDLIYPIFVIEGSGIKQEVASMPGIFQFSPDRLHEELDRVAESGVKALLLFGIPAKKDELATSAYDDKGAVQEAVRLIKRDYPDLLVICDVCLCEYTSNGHCGLIGKNAFGSTVILNDATLPLLAKMSVSLARAGADIIAPSDMMDGRVAAIREALDQAGFTDRAIMAYSAKFASAYYGPFRDAAGSAPAFGDRKSYQMDPANGREALREIAADIAEGADFIMVKPALAYLDVVKEARARFDLPVVTYNVSGEYAMVKAAAAAGFIDEKRIVLENLLAMKRAGAKLIITYHALEAARWLKNEF